MAARTLLRAATPSLRCSNAALPRMAQQSCVRFNSSKPMANRPSSLKPDTTIKEDYPKPEEREQNDPGHSTFGDKKPDRFETFIFLQSMHLTAILITCFVLCRVKEKRTLSSFSFESKVCVITGAARGLGNLFARTFVESGVSHISLDRMSVSSSRKVILTVQSRGCDGFGWRLGERSSSRH